MTDPDRIVIVRDRYSGAYSHARYTAWWHEEPDEVESDDVTCSLWWEAQRGKSTRVVGLGYTQQKALVDLLNKSLGVDDD